MEQPEYNQGLFQVKPLGNQPVKNTSYCVLPFQTEAAVKRRFRTLSPAEACLMPRWAAGVNGFHFPKRLAAHDEQGQI